MGASEKLEELTLEEMRSIIKAVIAYNGGKIEFLKPYLKYADELPWKVERKDDVLIVTAPLMK